MNNICDNYYRDKNDEKLLTLERHLEPYPFLVSVYYKDNLVVEMPIDANNSREVRKKIYSIFPEISFASPVDVVIRELDADDSGNECYQMREHHSF